MIMIDFTGLFDARKLWAAVWGGAVVLFLLGLGGWVLL